jgi:hypothetical protein
MTREHKANRARNLLNSEDRPGRPVRGCISVNATGNKEAFEFDMFFEFIL